MRRDDLPIPYAADATPAMRLPARAARKLATGPVRARLSETEGDSHLPAAPKDRRLD